MGDLNPFNLPHKPLLLIYYCLELPSPGPVTFEGCLSSCPNTSLCYPTSLTCVQCSCFNGLFFFRLFWFHGVNFSYIYSQTNAVTVSANTVLEPFPATVTASGGLELIPSSHGDIEPVQCWLQPLLFRVLLGRGAIRPVRIPL